MSSLAMLAPKSECEGGQGGQGEFTGVLTGISITGAAGQESAAQLILSSRFNPCPAPWRCRRNIVQRQKIVERRCCRSTPRNGDSNSINVIHGYPAQVTAVVQQWSPLGLLRLYTLLVPPALGTLRTETSRDR